MRSRHRILGKFIAGSACAVATWATPMASFANPNPDLPTPLEKLQMPAYCHDGGNAITAACGVFMNHYCSGLNFLNRANNLKFDKQARRNYLRRGRTDMDYTLNKMPAKCPFAADINATNSRMKITEMLLK